MFTFWILFCSGHPRVLDWSTRLSILKQIAEGLVFLHEVKQPSILEWDITAHNIFLDQDLNPTIVDIGSKVGYNYDIRDPDYTSIIRAKRYLFY